ncbi:hypothetical protein AB833_07965 [Chromatiales bacterium (ex Bugula neritina AB1)]|nr:hypothetical protein AB833_07965 [Chromatiales bacterium (ex Bugula neritina AB1)]
MSRGNSLQAALTGAASAPVKDGKSAAAKKNSSARSGKGRAAAAGKSAKSATTKSAGADGADTTGGRARDNTVLVGAHFPKHVLRQLRLIAAEEDTTNQALIAEALDLLFLKKGKQKIDSLIG